VGVDAPDVRPAGRAWTQLAEDDAASVGRPGGLRILDGAARVVCQREDRRLRTTTAGDDDERALDDDEQPAPVGRPHRIRRTGKAAEDLAEARAVGTNPPHAAFVDARIDPDEDDAATVRRPRGLEIDRPVRQLPHGPAARTDDGEGRPLAAGRGVAYEHDPPAVGRPGRARLVRTVVREPADRGASGDVELVADADLRVVREVAAADEGEAPAVGRPRGPCRRGRRERQQPYSASDCRDDRDPRVGNPRRAPDERDRRARRRRQRGHQSERPRRESSSAASSTRSTAVCPSSHSASSRMPSPSSTRGRYPSRSCARRTSAKQLRMSPTRDSPVISGSTSLPTTSASCSARSRTVTLRPLPMLTASPSAPSLASASPNARAMSCTETKSRRWSPSSKIRGARSFSRREAKIARTPVYGFESAWRVPYVLKSRSATVGIPYASPATRQARSWSYL